MNEELMNTSQDSEVFEIGFQVDETGDRWEVAERVACLREDCNCCGTWTNGNPELVDEWVRVDELED